MSPTSLKLTLAALKKSQYLNLKECLVMEFRMMMNCMKGHDFLEGIRAVLVDKDNNPKWLPNSLSEVNSDIIDNYFISLGDNELNLD
jgi:hypothetical protein